MSAVRILVFGCIYPHYPASPTPYENTSDGSGSKRRQVYDKKLLDSLECTVLHCFAPLQLSTCEDIFEV